MLVVLGRTPHVNSEHKCSKSESHPHGDPPLSTPPGAQALTAGEMNFAETPPLCRGDGEEMPFAGHALELVSAALVELKS
jgi:hypothetical protein